MTATLRRAPAASAPDEPRTDAELLRRFRDTRDQTAFAALVQRHGPLVVGLCTYTGKGKGRIFVWLVGLGVWTRGFYVSVSNIFSFFPVLSAVRKRVAARLQQGLRKRRHIHTTT